MSEFAEYEEIHVISDIHMGGRPGFQVLRETQRLADFIRWVAMQRPAERVALILNGDVFDTLAEDISGYVAVDDGWRTIRRIIFDEPAFEPVWDALKEFVHTELRTLVIIIGNHDIEVSFPSVQRLIIERLTTGNAEAKARIEFSTQGAGYTCTVGKARVFCTHGNEVDAWNFNRYEDLSKVARRLNVGRPLVTDDWIPNAGTRMVKEVMNDIKRKYAWIDLLKPENSAAVGTLLAIDPSQVGKIKQLPAIVGAKLVGDSQVDQRLSADGLQVAASTEPFSLDSMLGPNVLASMQSAGSRPSSSGDEMLLAMESRTPGVSPDTVKFKDAPLGLPQLIWDRLTGWITGVGPEEALRQALQDWLKGDASFDIDNQDETYTEVTNRLGPNIDFVVTGHTHLERAIKRERGGFYFNCGTWIRLMRFTEAMLANTQSFNPVYGVLTNGSMSAIDSAMINGKPLLLDQTSSVSISLDGARTVGRLNHVDANGQPVPVQEFVRT